MSTSKRDRIEKTISNDHDSPKVDIEEGAVEINASGHSQELERNFSLVSICAVGIVTGNAWAALGGSIVVALYNGGPPGVVFEFITVSVFYWMVASCIAELASAMPSSSGVYLWASVTAGTKHSKLVGFMAGWWNFFAWIFGSASMSSILANQILAMWGLFHPDYVASRWNVFVVYLILSWSCCACVLFANRALPMINNLGLFFILAGCFISVLVCAIMPSTTGSGYASNSAVWSEWDNQTGYSSNGLVFLSGMLNGAYAVGTPDCVSHLAEEIPNPRVNIPKAIAAQMGVGFITGLIYLIALFYSVNDISAVLSTTFTNPLAEVYRQATGSNGGSLGLMIVIFLPTVCTCVGTYIVSQPEVQIPYAVLRVICVKQAWTAGRMLWTLARERATPYSDTLGKISPRFGNPFAATVVCGCICTILGVIYIGSSVAFNAFVGSFVVLTSASYLTAILPHLLSGRKNVVPGYFWMPNSMSYVITAIACAYIMTFIVIFCFPYSMPVTSETLQVSMNWTCVVTGGLTIFIALFYPWQSRNGLTSPADSIRNLSVANTVPVDG